MLNFGKDVFYLNKIEVLFSFQRREIGSKKQKAKGSDEGI